MERRRATGSSEEASSPRTRTAPASNAVSPLIARSRVVFPDPLSPTRAMQLPASTRKLAPSSAVASP